MVVGWVEGGRVGEGGWNSDEGAAAQIGGLEPAGGAWRWEWGWSAGWRVAGWVEAGGRGWAERWRVGGWVSPRTWEQQPLLGTAARARLPCAAHGIQRLQRHRPGCLQMHSSTSRGRMAGPDAGSWLLCHAPTAAANHLMSPSVLIATF